MKVTGLVGALSVLAASAVASPSQYYPPTCKVNKCLSSLNSAAALRSCDAFLQKTVTPCPSTVTKTKTTTVTTPKTAVVSQNTLVVVTEQSVESLTSTSTIVDLETVYVPSHVVLTETSVVQATITISNPGKMKKRKVPQCVPTTASATVLPACGKACAGTAQFSSACSCIGATARTMTAKRPTTTVTTTKTVVKTPTVTTLTTVRTLTSTFKTTKTSVIPAVITVTSSVSVPTYITDVTLVEVTSTTSVAPPGPACTQFTVKLTKSGGEVGYVAAPPNIQGIATFSSSPLDAVKFFWDGNYFYQVGTHTTKLFVNDNQNNELPGIVWLTSGQMSPVTCTPKGGIDASMTCSSPVFETKNKWQICPNASGRQDLYIGKTVTAGTCNAIVSVYAEPACSTVT